MIELSKRQFKLWTQQLLDWLEGKFTAVARSIDFTTVNNKIDAVGGKVDTVSGKIDNLPQPDLSSVAKQGTNPNATNTAILQAIPSVAGLASESNATANKNEVKQEIRNVAGDCIIPDFEEEGLALTGADGFCSIYFMEEVEYGRFGKEALHCAEYKVGSIIKVTGENDYQGNPYFVAISGVSDVDNPEIESDAYLYGYTDILFWQKDHYYRVTGIYDCENRISGETEKLFTYEEVDPATVTDLGKQIVDKVDEVLAIIAANAGIPTMTIPDSTAAQELAPNVLYIFATRTSTLTLTLGTPIVGIANEYHFFIICGATAPTVNFPAGISWNGGSAPTIAADKTYEISILNNVAAYFEV